MLTAMMACLSAVASKQIALDWNAVQRQLAKNAGLVSHEIDVRYEIPGDAGPRSGGYRMRVHGWDRQGNPVRELVGQGDEGDEDRMAKLDLSLSERIVNHPDALFETPSEMTALDDRTIDGLPCVGYALHSRLAGGKRPITAQLWLDRKTGALKEVDGTVEKPGLPGVKNVSFVLHYRDDADGRSLPERLELRYDVAIFFNHGTVSFVERFGDWRPRP